MIKYSEIAEVIGQDKLMKLLSFRANYLAEQKIYYWQEVIFEQLEKELNFKMPKTAREFLEMFAGNEEIAPVEKKMMSSLSITDATVELPDEYVKLVNTLDKNTIFFFNNYKEEEPDFEGRPWYIKTKENLSEEIKVYGSGVKPFHNCLKLFLDLHLEFTGQSMVNSNCGLLSKNRVYDGFVIGEDNADYLYLDKADGYSVWIFHHDGCDVERVAYSFKEWVGEAKRE